MNQQLLEITHGNINAFGISLTDYQLAKSA